VQRESYGSGEPAEMMQRFLDQRGEAARRKAGG